MIIKNGLVFTGTEFKQKDLYTDGVIIACSCSCDGADASATSEFDGEIIDATGLYVMFTSTDAKVKISATALSKLSKPSPNTKQARASQPSALQA